MWLNDLINRIRENKRCWYERRIEVTWANIKEYRKAAYYIVQNKVDQKI